MASDLTWPPTREDLERLYLVERLSAAKIANIYELKYKNPKVAESTILYQLRKNGIPRRDSAEHIRKVSGATVQEWIRRYGKGESLRKIAGNTVDPVTVWNHLRKENVELRDRVEAQIASVTKHPRKSFDGGKEMQAYLVGLTQGDLYVSRHGRLVRVKTASTHPAMFSLLKLCFDGYGSSYVSPKKSSLAGYEWAFTFDLESSFNFLLHRHVAIPGIARGPLFAHYLGGLFDAEGSIFENSVGWFEASISNSNVNLLRRIQSRLTQRKIHSKIVRVGPTQLSPEGEMWQLRVWRREDLRRFLEVLPLRHPEKVEKRKIAISRYKTNTPQEAARLAAEWDLLLESIRSDRNRYVKEAETAYLSRRASVDAGPSITGPPLQANNSFPKR